MTTKSSSRGKAHAEGRAETPAAAGWLTVFAYGALTFTAVFTLFALGLTFLVNRSAATFAAEGWGTYGEMIARNRVAAAWHGVFMLVAASAAIGWVARRAVRTGLAAALAWGLVLLVAADAWYVSRHYVLTQSTDMLADNDVLRVLKSDPTKFGRVALVTQDGFYNQWLTYVFPYHGIRTLNITQMPRMPDDYRRFLDSVARQPLRYWQLGAVDYVLAPAQIWSQIQNDPEMKKAFDLVYAFNVESVGGGMVVRQGSETSPGQHVILRLRAPSPMYAVFQGWKVVDDEEALRQLTSPGVTLFEQVLVAKDTAVGLPASHLKGFDENIQVLARRSGYTHLKVSVTSPSILRVAEKYDASWKVKVDGQPASLLRVDFLFQGVLLQPGVHDVVLRFAPPNGTFWIQILGILIVLAAGASLALHRRRSAQPGDAP